MVNVSCSGRFHAFALAEQLEMHGLLAGFYTSYAWQKNKLMRRFTSRVDKEQIPAEKIHTAIPIAAMMRMGIEPFVYNEIYDRWVARKIARDHRSKVFIGWSGMSLLSIRKAKEMGKAAIVERGSAHIQYQEKILAEEYKKFGIRFNIDPRVMEKEMLEYEEADFISVPSTFSKKSFLEYGVPASKLIVNNYGAGSLFKPASPEPKQVFRVVYLGSLTIQKGMVYLFQALHKLNIPGDKFEAWFIGKVDDEIKGIVEKYTQPNWKFFGHINHYDLPKYLTQCDVAAMPSIQDGFGMVIPQLLGCGMP
ncbi:MAG: glycosyltransferase, partial [Saprospiraceae bacterium]